MKKHNKITNDYIGSLQSKKTACREAGIQPPRFGGNSAHSASSHSKHKTPVDSNKYRGYKNFATWETAATIQNNEGLHNMCKELFEDGYKTFSSMRGKLMEFGPRWKADHMTSIYWNDDNLCAKELTQVLVDLFAKPTKTKK